MRPDTLGVIGLGAIGGSVAWQAARLGVPRVIGFDRATAESVAAVKAGAVTELAHDPKQVLRRADLVVFATPPAATLQLLQRYGDDLRGTGVLCTDVTSVKRPVVRLAAELGVDRTFAGSHPLAGTHRTGFSAARADLFARAVVYVTPAGPDDAPAREVADFWSQTMEAHPVLMAAETHDELLAWTSHLPQAVASALAVAIAGGGPRGMTCGPGARDTTRLAASSVEMWRDLLLMNRAAILDALDGFEDAVGTLRHALVHGDERRLGEWLERGAAWRRGIEP